MIYYGVLPVSISENETVEYIEVEYMGQQVLASKQDIGYVLERIYSTNPQDYLNEKLQPGTLLENALIKQNIQ